MGFLIIYGFKKIQKQKINKTLQDSLKLSLWIISKYNSVFTVLIQLSKSIMFVLFENNIK